jgi:hypothetical protein
MFLSAAIDAKPKSNAYEVQRSLLIDDTNLFVVKDSTLALVPIEVLYKTNRSVIVEGLEDGMNVITKAVPGGISGMKVIPKLNSN